ncbi:MULTISPECIES: response regulator transcription factor [Comamonas]|jgi:DNA-binding NarL/FixJ family response regulator|uniref:DNA-binding response regulator n=1 Tax=Comamonas terrigena TaxID=32013 RepID=A0A2A7UWR1_COMTR|nr:response regulator transcription factor [Comamonas terrigena]MBD9531461.1 response regulator transcription factor [Comamonas sp. CMM01]PEH89636.1 DNA-binding response regulator [Comamonas terrigena]BBL24842.1 DNA-binding response regulator [Comamonas terrigena NBRC 13299]SUY71566.1 Response regulator protein vraR [Comamonas terrigena]
MHTEQEAPYVCDAALLSAGSAGAVDRSLWPDFMVGQSEKPVRVLLVDDDAHIRSVVGRELMGDSRVLLVGQAASVKEARRLMRAEAFDVLLADLNLEDGTGFDLMGLQRALRPAAETVIISVMEGDTQLLRAIEQGAAGYLVKHSWFGSYVQAVLQVANGGASITPHLARRLLQRLRGNCGERDAKACVPEKLSERERDILRHVANGYTSQEISQRLEIALLTVNTHVRNIYRKLQVRSRAQAVRAALTQGLL